MMPGQQGRVLRAPHVPPDGGGGYAPPIRFSILASRLLFWPLRLNKNAFFLFLIIFVDLFCKSGPLGDCYFWTFRVQNVNTTPEAVSRC
eukprot:326597-Prorocentrum_minimum.AAC.1